MPDMRESISHLTPLKLPAQITVYGPETREKFGYQVCIRSLAALILLVAIGIG